MSEIPLGSGESGDEEDPLYDALIEFTACIGAAVGDICSYGFTIGDTYVPFDPDEDDDECDTESVQCSQVWTRVMGAQPKDEGAGGWDGNCALVMTLDIEVGVLRCVEVPDGGEAPTATEVMTAGLQAMADMKAILCAALGCDTWDDVEPGTWRPIGPLGGQYGGVWTFTVEI